MPCARPMDNKNWTISNKFHCARRQSNYLQFLLRDVNRARSRRHSWLCPRRRLRISRKTRVEDIRSTMGRVSLLRITVPSHTKRVYIVYARVRAGAIHMGWPLFVRTVFSLLFSSAGFFPCPASDVAWPSSIYTNSMNAIQISHSLRARLLRCMTLAVILG